MTRLKETLQPTTSHTTIESPLGDLTVVVSGADLVGLYFPHHWYLSDRSAFGPRNDAGTEEVRRQLGEYFAGHRQSFELLLTAQGDARQQRVWALIGRVPYGQTATYGSLARELDDGTTPQEVGQAVGRNPLSIVVPCHRIVGSSGKLVGYAGGLPRKQFLLDLERDVVERPSRLF
jgi:methylated-DNA-[protein]-cysteine S-methyltransferase